MITKLILDTIGRFSNGVETELLRAGTPLEFLEFAPKVSTPGGNVERIRGRLPNGRVLFFDASAVEAFHEPEETLPALAEITGIPYNTLARYARAGRFLARKSGGVWLSTVTAVEFAGIRPRGGNS